MQAQFKSSTLTGRNTRVTSIQWLRGIAAMLVVFNHAAVLPFEFGTRLDEIAFRTELFNLARLGAVGVDIFFVISGFVMALTALKFQGPSGAGMFLVHRYNRIAPLFYLASGVLFIEMLRSGVPYTTSKLLNTITFIPLIDWNEYTWPVHFLGWTLAFEFLFYLVVASLILVRPASRVTLLLAATVLLPIAGVLISGQWVAWTMLTSPMMWEFALGVFAFLAWRRNLFGRYASAWRIAALVALPLLLAPALSNWSRIDLLSSEFLHREGAFLRAICWGLPAFFIVGGLLSLAGSREGGLSSVLRTVGDASYSIYLTHIFVVRLAGEAIERVGLEPVAATIIVLCVSPFVGILFYRLVERPLLKKGQRLILTSATQIHHIKTPARLVSRTPR